MKLTWCHNRLAIGSAFTDATLDTLGNAGVTHLINCRRDPNYAKELEVLQGITVLWNPIFDDGDPKPAEWFGKALDFALGALASPRHKICVCCFLGSNRSPSVALAILMAQGWEFDDALQLVLKARPEAMVLYQDDAKAAVKLLGYV